MVAVILPGLLLTAQPAAAISYPGYAASYYMDTVNVDTMYDMGCALGDAREGGSAPQDALVILDWGQAQLRDGVYGTYDFSDHYRTVTQIKNAVVAYAHGFWYCTGGNTGAHVRIGIGTSNFADFCKSCGMTDAEVTGHGEAWADMVDGANAAMSSAGYSTQADAVGAADIEVSWGTSTTARRWIDAYETVNSWAIYDYGDAAGCRQSGTVKAAAVCGGTWSQDDLYYIAWGAQTAFGVPEIYREDSAQAKQWQQISKWGTLNGKSKIIFAGVMTQAAACTGSCADAGLDNSPQEGWTQLRDRCATDAATTLGSLRFATDIRWH